MNTKFVKGALGGFIAWMLFWMVYGYFNGANDEFFQCEPYHIRGAIWFAIELSAFLFPVTIGVTVLGGVVGLAILRFR